jgi:hypothetical protein
MNATAGFVVGGRLGERLLHEWIHAKARVEPGDVRVLNFTTEAYVPAGLTHPRSQDWHAIARARPSVGRSGSP